MIDCFDHTVQQRIDAAERLWLFLDYDGTLADFAPTPDDILPDAELIDLLTALARTPRLRVAVVSGRRLAHIQQLVPVPGILLAGTYGIEVQLADGTPANRLPLGEVRPTIAAVKQLWRAELAGHGGFFLEDKEWTLAIHAKDADPAVGARVLASAEQGARHVLRDAPPDRFRILGGDRFLELGPTIAHKGETVRHLLHTFAWPDALPVYLGDDDKDEEAFDVIADAGGLALMVATAPRPTKAVCRLESPQATRRWLATLLAQPLAS